MKVKIEDPVTYAPTESNTFIVEILQEAQSGEIEYGCVDYLSSIPRDREDILIEIIKTLEEMKNKRPDDYDEVEGFYKWFEKYSHDRDEFESLVEDISIEWETAMDNRAELSRYNVYYYDNEGVQYNVSFESND